MTTRNGETAVHGGFQGLENSVKDTFCEMEFGMRTYNCHYNTKQSEQKSQTFRLHSIKDDKSVLQEDLLSRKTNEEKNNLDSELQVILQPEFIKSIGLSTANGEILSPVGKRGRLVNGSFQPRAKKPNRLERRIECQT